MQQSEKLLRLPLCLSAILQYLYRLQDIYFLNHFLPNLYTIQFEQKNESIYFE